MTKFIFFDVANTLLHKPAVFEAWNQLLTPFGVPKQAIKSVHKTVSEIIKFPDQTDRLFYDFFNAEVLLALGIKPTEGLLVSIYQSSKGLDWQSFDDLQHLRVLKLPMGIISNWDLSLTKHLAPLGIVFDPVVGSATAGVCKPDIRIFENALRSLTKTYDRVYFVGDSIKLDILPAAQVGMYPILIDREQHYPHFDGIKIQSLEELNQIVGKDDK